MKFLLGFISFVGFIALLCSGAYLGYGFLTEKVQEIVLSQEEAIEDNLSLIEGASVQSIDVTNLYFAKNFQSIAIDVEIERLITVEEKTYTAKLNNPSELTEANSEFTYGAYHDVTRVISDHPEEVKGNAITFIIISLSTWIGFWILKTLA